MAALPSFAKPTIIRSSNMRAIKSTGNLSTEWKFRSILIRNGIRGWKVHSKKVIGNPDFAFPEDRLVVFLDGCYWHGCPNCGHIPKTNHEYWSAKIGRNKKRDRANSRKLRQMGFKVIRIWECKLKRDPKKCLSRIVRALASNSKFSI